MSLVSLPFEIGSCILELLGPQDILRLSAAGSKALYEACHTDSVWRHVVEGIHDKFRRKGPEDAALGAMEVGWYEAAKFLVPYTKYLGYFVSSSVYTCRIICLSTRLVMPSDRASTSPHPYFAIVADQLGAVNRLDDPMYEPEVPLARSIPYMSHQFNGRNSYDVPLMIPASINSETMVQNNHPDAGLSVDLLHPSFNFHELFTIDPKNGATLTSSQDNPFSPSAQLRIILLPASATISKECRTRQSGQADADNIYALFTGRAPKRPWPTVHLYRGALRGMVNWTTERGLERSPLAVRGDGEDTTATANGFFLQFRKRVERPPPSTPATRRAEHYEPLDPDFPTRRPGVGMNGGPSILWNGAEQDPTVRRAVAIVRADGGRETGGPGGFTFHVRQPIGGEMGDDFGEEIVRTEKEDFFPMNPPAGRLSSDAPSLHPTDDIPAASLEGLWLGTYGGHGLEFGHLSVEVFDSGNEELLSSGAQPANLSHRRAEEGWKMRRMRYVKVTGDTNVPSGEVSWVADLPPFMPSNASDLGTVPSISADTLIRWSKPPLDDTPSEVPSWDHGSCSGSGRIALSGYVQASWTPATITLIRSSVKVSNSEERYVDGVEELRLRWAELGKVGVFRRVRI